MKCPTTRKLTQIDSETDCQKEQQKRCRDGEMGRESVSREAGNERGGLQGGLQRKRRKEKPSKRLLLVRIQSGDSQRTAVSTVIPTDQATRPLLSRSG